MTNQTKNTIEEILHKYHAEFSCNNIDCARDTKHANCRAEALTAINKEIERIGLEVIGSDEPVISNLSPNKTSASYRNKLRATQRARLTQALKGREGESDARS